jgi:hypothetical protein
VTYSAQCCQFDVWLVPRDASSSGSRQKVHGSVASRCQDAFSLVFKVLQTLQAKIVGRCWLVGDVTVCNGGFVWGLQLHSLPFLLQVVIMCCALQGVMPALCSGPKVKCSMMLG